MLKQSYGCGTRFSTSILLLLASSYQRTLLCCLRRLRLSKLTPG